MKAFTLASLAALVTVASAAPEINVRLEVQDNSKVRAVVSNVGPEVIKAVTRGGLLSKAPIQKVQVSSQDGRVEFKGPHLSFDTINLRETEYETIAPGQSIERVFDIAEWFDLSKGGNFDIRSIGKLQYSQDGGIESLPYVSNTVSAMIDGAQAAAMHSSHMDKHDAMVRRATIDSDCDGNKRGPISKSIKNTRELAIAGAKAARSGPASRLKKIFKRSDNEARQITAEVFDKIAKYYNSETSGIPANHCTDIAGYCAQYGATAYALPERSIVGFCDKWFTDYPEVNKNCARHDQGVIALHEATHLNEVKSTIDNEGEKDNLNHADSYAQFAHQALFNCPS